MESVNQKDSNQAFIESDKMFDELGSRENLDQATGGCFWCLEGPFEAMEGVVDAMAGYVGEGVRRPVYDEVTSGDTGFREAVQIFYHPTKLDYRDLLETFFWQIDPTDKGGQFADRGEHYTTAVYYHHEKQKLEAENYLKELEKNRYDDPIVTKILPYPNFYPAEDYHQDFYRKRADYYRRYKKASGRQGYIEAMQEKFG